MARPSWTAEERAELASLWADQSLSCKDIAIRVRRSVEAVKCMAHRLDVPQRQGAIQYDKTWQQDDLAILRDMVKAGETSGAIAKKLGRTQNAIQVRARREGLRTIASGWSRPDVETLLALHKSGLSPAAIAEKMPGRNEKACRSKLVALDAYRPFIPPEPETIVDPTTENVAPNPHKWTPPPKVAWPALIIGSAKTCQYPKWKNGQRAPNPPTFCGSPVERDSLCAAHHATCYVAVSS